MKYMKAMIEAVELKAEDVVLTSACAEDFDCPDDEDFCGDDFVCRWDA